MFPFEYFSWIRLRGIKKWAERRKFQRRREEAYLTLSETSKLKCPFVFTAPTFRTAVVRPVAESCILTIVGFGLGIQQAPSFGQHRPRRGSIAQAKLWECAA
jgi:hypothetical protein